MGKAITWINVETADYKTNVPFSCVYLLYCQVLEYIGRGKSITDVGLAQARYPLNTTHHYFEIEITDPGENCYIAIGLARRVKLKLF